MLLPSSAPRLGFIGAGRLGRALAWALARRESHVVAVASRSVRSAQALASGIPGCRAMTHAQEVVDASDIVFLTVPDSAIRGAADALTWNDRVAAVHCSGATPLDALDSARQQAAAIGGFHPMQTFSDPEAAIRSLPGCTITIEAEGELARHLADLAGCLQCRINRLPAGARARYHAAGAYASQLVNVLLREASRIWQSFGKSEEDAVKALLPLAHGTLAAIEASGLAAAMPGPISRGDVATVARHVDALNAVDPAIADLYCAMSLRAIPLALERGSLDPARAAEFESLLRGLCPQEASVKGSDHGRAGRG